MFECLVSRLGLSFSASRARYGLGFPRILRSRIWFLQIWAKAAIKNIRF